jgi:Xaa-Pro dipeptidase
MMSPQVGFERQLAFQMDEYNSRVARVRELMEGARLDSLLVFTPENVNYLLGYDTIGYSSFLCLALPRAGEPVFVVREMERGVAQSTTWADHIATFEDSEDPVARTVEHLRSAGLLGGRVGLESASPFMTAQRWIALRDALPGDAVAVPRLVEEVRRVKSSGEVAYIRDSCRLAGLGMAAALEAVGAGATENDVAAAAYAALVRGGSDPLTSQPIVTSGERSGVAHTSFAGRRLREGDTVLVELAGNRRHYGGALMRTAVLGEPGDEVRRLDEAARSGLQAAISAIAPGVACGEVDRACREVIEAAGFEPNFRKRTGYSIGIAFAPDWGEGHIVSLRRDDPTPLQPGMTFHLPPALRVFQRMCVGVSETVLVTAEGCEVLTEFPEELRVVH